MNPCAECPYVGNDEICWDGCYLLRELEQEIADEFEPEVADDDGGEPPSEGPK
jgi:hypothetical protein